MTSKKYATDYEEVKRLGGDGVNTPSARTADETEIALFWLESSPLQWNRIARTVSNDAGLDAWENARLFGLLNLALADGYISSFETKNHYNFWRPVTAIREGDNDGNRRTDGDTTWTPLVTTPPIPDHDSAHSVEGGAAAQVLMRFFGTDRHRFRDVQPDVAGGANLCRHVAGAPLVHQLHGSGRRERRVADPGRIPLPARRRRGHRARPAHRRSRR